MPIAENPVPVIKDVAGATKNFAVNKWDQGKTYAKDLKEAAPEMWENKADTGKAVTKGFADRTTDAANGMYDTTVGLPAVAGSWLGNQFNKGIYWFLTNGGRGEGKYMGAPAWKRYMERYNQAIPESQEQIMSVMDPVNNLNEKIQNSEILKEKNLSGKTQEVARRLGGVFGTGAETLMYAGLGGPSLLKWTLKHPVAGFGIDLAQQYGMQDVRDNSLASGAHRTYWQQANEYANNFARNAIDERNKMEGVTPTIFSRQADKEEADYITQQYAPIKYKDFLTGLQYNQ